MYICIENKISKETLKAEIMNEKPELLSVVTEPDGDQIYFMQI